MLQLEERNRRKYRWARLHWWLRMPGSHRAKENRQKMKENFSQGHQSLGCLWIWPLFLTCTYWSWALSLPWGNNTFTINQKTVMVYILLQCLANPPVFFQYASRGFWRYRLSWYMSQTIAKISAVSVHWCQRETQREKWRKQKKLNFQAMREHSRLGPQGLCPPALGGGSEESYSVWGAGCDQLMDFFVIGWLWGNWESVLSAFWFQPVLGLYACR